MCLHCCNWIFAMNTVWILYTEVWAVSPQEGDCKERMTICVRPSPACNVRVIISRFSHPNHPLPLGQIRHPGYPRSPSRHTPSSEIFKRRPGGPPPDLTCNIHNHGTLSLSRSRTYSMTWYGLSGAYRKYGFLLVFHFNEYSRVLRTMEIHESAFVSFAVLTWFIFIFRRQDFAHVSHVCIIIVSWTLWIFRRRYWIFSSQ